MKLFSSFKSIGGRKETVARASVLMVAANILLYSAGLIKEVLAAKIFGIGAAMDAFKAALAPALMVNFVFLATFAAVFIPRFVKLKKSFGIEKANIFATAVIKKLLPFLLVISVLFFLAAPIIIKYGYRGLQPGVSDIAVGILRLLSFAVFAGICAGLFTEILNALEHFSIPAFSNSFVSIFTIIFLLTITHRYGIYVMVFGVFSGYILQFIILLPIASEKGFTFMKNPPDTEILKDFFRPALIFLAALVAQHSTFVVDSFMASWAGPGNVAVLGYSISLATVPVVIFGSSLARALFPYYSSRVADKDRQGMGKTTSGVLRISALIFFPLTALALALAGPAVEVIYMRGAFGVRAARLTAAAFSFYAPVFFFFSGQLIMTRVFLSMGNMKFLLKASLLQVVLNIVFNLFFMRVIDPPVAGIALSTSAVFLILFFYFLRRLALLGININLEELGSSSLKSFIAALGTGFTAWFLRRAFSGFYAAAGLGGKISVIIFCSLAGLAIFLILLLILKSPELKKISLYAGKGSGEI